MPRTPASRGKNEQPPLREVGGDHLQPVTVAPPVARVIRWIQPGQVPEGLYPPRGEQPSHELVHGIALVDTEVL